VNFYCEACSHFSALFLFTPPAEAGGFQVSAALELVRAKASTPPAEELAIFVEKSFR